MFTVDTLHKFGPWWNQYGAQGMLFVNMRMLLLCAALQGDYGGLVPQIKSDLRQLLDFGLQALSALQQSLLGEFQQSGSLQGRSRGTGLGWA